MSKFEGLFLFAPMAEIKEHGHPIALWRRRGREISQPEAGTLRRRLQTFFCLGMNSA
jgi:hypothetical protein